ncbi:hypothetical protein OAS39_12580 [Pirellulales bacterium]|nr:hypothetical protein [Pirellulales bacterium]
MDNLNNDNELERQVCNVLPVAGEPPPFDAMWTQAIGDVRRRRTRRVVYRAAAAALVVAATWMLAPGPQNGGTPADAELDFAELELDVEEHLQPSELFWTSPTQFLVDFQYEGHDAFDTLQPADASVN